MYLCRLGFVSEPDWAALGADTDATLKAILEAGLRNNARNNITGVLIFDGRLFLQVMEGRREVLMQTFDRIRDDTRHNRIQLMGLSEINERCFEDWSVLTRRRILSGGQGGIFPDRDIVSFEMLVAFARRQRASLLDTTLIELDDAGKLSAQQF